MLFHFTFLSFYLSLREEEMKIFLKLLIFFILYHDWKCIFWRSNRISLFLSESSEVGCGHWFDEPWRILHLLWNICSKKTAYLLMSHVMSFCDLLPLGVVNHTASWSKIQYPVAHLSFLLENWVEIVGAVSEGWLFLLFWEKLTAHSSGRNWMARSSSYL